MLNSASSPNNNTGGGGATTLGAAPTALPPGGARRTTKAIAAGAVSNVDNRMVTLPILDYSFSELTEVRQMLSQPPRDGKPVTDNRIAWHYLDFLNQKEKEDARKADEAAAAQTTEKRDEITIKAKDRKGEQKAIIIDRNALQKKQREAAKDPFEEEVVVKEDRVRYVASGLKLCKNQLTDARDLDRVLKLSVLNAFYFLNWVDLSSNKLTSVPDLSQFPIVVLYLHDNCIDNLKSILELRQMKQLQSLTMFGNPIQEDAPSAKAYKFQVLSAIKGPSRDCKDLPLKTFDHTVLSTADRQNVDQYAKMIGGLGMRPVSKDAKRGGSAARR